MLPNIRGVTLGYTSIEAFVSECWKNRLDDEQQRDGDTWCVLFESSPVPFPVEVLNRIRGALFRPRNAAAIRSTAATKGRRRRACGE
jgi:hypothetical protein